MPDLRIIELSACNKLPALEINWIKEFNSINNGLNITSGGDVAGIGTNNSSSKYTKRQILKVFSLLYRTTKPYIEIMELTGVNTCICKDIVYAGTHPWLRDEYPNQYNILLSNIPKRINPHNVSYRHSDIKLKSPDGHIYSNIESIKNFATEHNLNPGNLSSLISGRYNSSKGWTVVK